ncbi:hypothetical protein [Chitinophaga sp.]|uniref:hypothetical protein n=1 Tax=Chitinophaga sp. TaxID=1869181 RepID=UPI0026028934|nr:hypothetical protein [uncultured Chitinophaga sp.]
MEHRPQEIHRYNKARNTFIACLLLFLTASALTFLYRGRIGAFFGIGAEKARLVRMLDSLQNEPPRFDIGYAIVELETFKKMLLLGKDTGAAPFMYPFVENDVTRMLFTNDPPLLPDYTHIPVAFDTDSFHLHYRKKETRLRETGVGCLMIRQFGAGIADSVTLTYTDLKPDKAENIYDGTDIASLRDSSQHLERKTFRLGDMPTGSAILVPLYVANFFDYKLDGEFSAFWRLITHHLIIPYTLNYHHLGKADSLSMGEVLTRPVDIR